MKKQKVGENTNQKRLNDVEEHLYATTEEKREIYVALQRLIYSGEKLC